MERSGMVDYRRKAGHDVQEWNLNEMHIPSYDERYLVSSVMRIIKTFGPRAMSAIGPRGPFLCCFSPLISSISSLTLPSSHQTQYFPTLSSGTND